MALSVVRRRHEAEGEKITLIIPEKLSCLTYLLTDQPFILYRRNSAHQFKDTVAEVNKEHFKSLYLLPHSFSAAFFGFRTGIRHRRGISAEARSLLLTDRVHPKFATRSRHLTDEYSCLLEIEYKAPECWNAPSYPYKLDTKEQIVLCPGAAFGPAKKWPYFAELVALFPDYHFVILGDKRDQQSGEQIASVFGPRVRNLAGKTTLEQAINEIVSSLAVVSNDSGLMHVAGFFGTPVVGIYGSTSPIWTRPLGPLVQIACTDCDCSPCFKRVCKRTENQYCCQKSITPDKVAELLRSVIRSPDSKVKR